MRKFFCSCSVATFASEADTNPAGGQGGSPRRERWISKEPKPEVCALWVIGVFRWVFLTQNGERMEKGSA